MKSLFKPKGQSSRQKRIVPNMLTLEEAAKIAGFSTMTLMDRIKHGAYEAFYDVDVPSSAKLSVLLASYERIGNRHMFRETIFRPWAEAYQKLPTVIAARAAGTEFTNVWPGIEWTFDAVDAARAGALVSQYLKADGSRCKIIIVPT